jgi:mannose-6-phosphate isomerase-like protein (cupin superfamily)
VSDAHHPLVIPLDDLAPTKHSHEFVGAEHGDVPFSIILVHSRPGVGPKVHRHPYAEVFIVESGEATFRLGDATVVVGEGHVVVGPPNVAHGFTNTGRGELRLVAIHGNPRFITEWLEGADPAWTSRPKR